MNDGLPPNIENEFESFIRKKGLKLTSQRRRILKRVFATNRHFTADEIHETFRRGRSDVSRATVYRTLSLLVEGGFIDMLELGGDTKRYEHILDREHHDHLMCTRCGAIEDLPLSAVKGHAELRCDETGPRIAEEIAVIVQGRCARCAAEPGG